MPSFLFSHPTGSLGGWSGSPSLLGSFTQSARRALPRRGRVSRELVGSERLPTPRQKVARKYYSGSARAFSFMGLCNTTSCGRVYGYSND